MISLRSLRAKITLAYKAHLFTKIKKVECSTFFMNFFLKLLLLNDYLKNGSDISGSNFCTIVAHPVIVGGEVKAL